MKYNHEDVDKMQQDAVKRIQEMQTRNKNSVANANKSPTKETASVMALPSEKNENHSSVETLPNSFFETLFGDKEKSLLLLLILILSSEKKGDTGLIFALMYLLL